MSSPPAASSTPVTSPADAPEPAPASTPTQALRKRQINDFEFGSILGEGSYSTVLYARETHTGHEYAVKMLDKRQIVRERKVKYVNLEKDVLNRLTHPFIIKLFYTFQDTHSLYFVLELGKNGDLLGFLKRCGRMGVDVARFYTAEIVTGVEFLHSHGVIHRDLKPENILLDENYHIKITDFGTAKVLDEIEKQQMLARGDATQQQQQAQSESESQSQQDTNQEDSKTRRRASFVGTAEYCSPELLNDREASFSSDVWAIGCILYQLLVGRPPFKGSNEYQTFQRIIHLRYMFPGDAVQAVTDGGDAAGAVEQHAGHDGSSSATTTTETMDTHARALIESILVLDAQLRPGLESVRRHAYFDGIVWDGLETQTPPRVDKHRSPLRVARTESVGLMMGSTESSFVEDDGVEGLTGAIGELGVEGDAGSGDHDAVRERRRSDSSHR